MTGGWQCSELDFKISLEIKVKYYIRFGLLWANLTFYDDSKRLPIYTCSTHIISIHKGIVVVVNVSLGKNVS